MGQAEKEQFSSLKPIQSNSGLLCLFLNMIYLFFTIFLIKELTARTEYEVVDDIMNQDVLKKVNQEKVRCKRQRYICLSA